MTSKPIINKVKNRFLPLTESVTLGLEKEPQLGDFEIMKELGSGSFGRVHLGIHKETNVQYAIKAIDKRNKANIEGQPYFRREIEIMYKIRHPNVVRLFSHFEDDFNCYFLMEYISHGNLYDLLSKQKTGKVDAQTVSLMMRDLISAVYYLHHMDPPIIHRDIKPENALLNEKNVVKLADFGWSNYIIESDEQKRERNTFCGTPIYLAPEMIDGPHDERVDIWCIGVLIFELLTGRPPFLGSDKNTLMTNILKLKINWPKEMNMDAKNLLLRILREAKTRISLEEMLKHPFFTKYSPYDPKILIKPSILPKAPFIVCKDDPDKIVECSINSLNQEDLQKTDISERKTIKRQRDLSPLPMSKLTLEQVDKGNDIITKKISNINVIPKQESIQNQSKLLKDNENLSHQINDLKKTNTSQNKRIDESENQIRYLTKEKETLLKERDEKEDLILELKKIVADLAQKLSDKEIELNLEIQGYQKKISRLEDDLVQKNQSHLDNHLTAFRDSITTTISKDNTSSDALMKNKEMFLNEIDTLKKELENEKIKFNAALLEKNKIIMKYQEEQKTLKDTEAKKYAKLIHKYECIMNLHDTENKKLKTRIKELESKISKINLTK